MMDLSGLTDYFSKLKWSNIIFIILISPLVMSFFWTFIGDPLIGHTSQKIDYGYIRYLPAEYYRVYNQDGRIELQKKHFKVWRSENEELIATCKPESFDVSYVGRTQSNGIKTYFMGLLPKTLYGNYSAHVTCTESEPSEANEWDLLFDDEGCVNVSYTEDIDGMDIQISKSAC